MAFKDQPWAQRYQVMGDTAEGVFAEVSPLGRFQRIGWRRPSVSTYRMSAVIKHMPDFYTSTGHLVEVMGVGKDGILKLKVDKFEALEWWAKAQPTALFVWNSHFGQWALVEWPKVQELVKAVEGKTEKFPEGNEYFPIPWSEIEGVALVGQP